MMRVGTTAKMMAFVTRAPYNGNAAALLRYRTGLRMMSAAPPSAKVRRKFLRPCFRIPRYLHCCLPHRFLTPFSVALLAF